MRTAALCEWCFFYLLLKYNFTYFQDFRYCIFAVWLNLVSRNQTVFVLNALCDTVITVKGDRHSVLMTTIVMMSPARSHNIAAYFKYPIIPNKDTLKRCRTQSQTPSSRQKIVSFPFTKRISKHIVRKIGRILLNHVYRERVHSFEFYSLCWFYSA